MGSVRYFIKVRQSNVLYILLGRLVVNMNAKNYFKKPKLR